ncbi:MAG TPA: hypothetical protein VKU80_02620 [Planctomycetota bacterium]|nr:hypothetical protein [Planctomycetota bacterium]
MLPTFLVGTLLFALQDSSSPKLQKTPPDGKIEHLDSISGPVCFNNDGSLAAVLLADTSEVILIDFAARKKLRTLSGLKRINRRGYIVPAVVPVLAFSRDSRFLLGGLFTTSEKGAGPQLIWEVRSGKAWGQFRAFEGPITAIAFTNDGKAFVTAGSNDAHALSADLVKVWAWDSDHPGVPKTPLRTLEVNNREITLGPGEKTILSRPSERGYESIDFETGELLQKVETPLSPGQSTWFGANCSQLSPDGKLLAIGSGFWREARPDRSDPQGVLRLWNVADTSLRREFLSARMVLGVSFTPDSKRVAVTAKITPSYNPCRTCIYDVESGDCLRRIEGEFSDAVVTPDGEWIVSAGTDEILLWKMPP